MIKSNLIFYDAIKIALAFAAVIIGFGVIFTLRDVFLLVLVAFIFSIALERPIEKMIGINVSRTTAVIALYSIAFIGIVMFFYSILPQLISEIKTFAASYPAYSEEILVEKEDALLDVSLYLRFFAEDMATSTDAIVGTVSMIFGGFLSFLAIFFISLFINIRKGGVKSLIPIIFPQRYVKDAELFFDRMQEKVSMWIWGKTLSSLLVGLLVFVGLVLMDIPYALILAMIAILFNYIPFVGPIVASVPAIALSFLQSPLHAMSVAALYFIVNTILESFVFGPLLMKRAININPAMLIIFVIIGERLGGLLGLIIAIPIAGIIYLFLDEYLARKKASKGGIA